MRLFQSRPSREEARAAHKTPTPAALEVAILIFFKASAVTLASVDTNLG